MMFWEEQQLLGELAEACARLAGVTPLKASLRCVPVDWNTAELQAVFPDAPPTEAVLGRLLAALNVWDPGNPPESSYL